MARLTVAILAALVGASAAIQQTDLSAWLSSTKGLNLSQLEADKIAEAEYKLLSMCRVSVDKLQALKDTLYSTSKLDFSQAEVRENLFSLAQQHVDPDNLDALYKGLYSTQGPDLAKKQAQGIAVKLANRRISPKDILALWKNLYGISGVNLPKAEAQTWVVDLVAAGANPQKLLDSYKAKAKTMDKGSALKAAVAEAVDVNRFGLQVRHAKDVTPYLAKQFQDYYRDQWLEEWLAAPEEKRTANDGHDYLISEFEAYFGSSWNSKWSSAPVAEQKRIVVGDSTRTAYTMKEFQVHYRDTWQQEFMKAAEVADECAFLKHDDCDLAEKQGKCTWKWTGDWTDSCIVKPRASADLIV